MRIIEVPLTFGSLTFRRRTNFIVVHHTAGGDQGAEFINRLHRQRGFGGIGYHFLIRRNGDIERGRPEATVGAHTRALNRTSIGVALTGNFVNTAPSPRQLQSLYWLLHHLKRRYPGIDLTWHNEHGATACPGVKLIPILEDLREVIFDGK